MEQINTLNEYQEGALETAFFPIQHNVIYPTLGLTGEAGEVADKVKKIIRDKDGILTQTDAVEIAKELGDVLWYIAVLSDKLGFTLQEVAQMNYDKLKSRQQRNKLSGNGDNR